jgi:hypothetical protein
MGRSIVERDRGKKEVCFFTGLLCVLLLSGCGGDIQPSDYSGRLVLSVQGERLSAKIEGVPIEIVLAELARQAHVKVSVAESVMGELVSVELENLPLEQGIRLILYDKDYALTYSDQPASSRRHGGPTVMEIHVVGARATLAQHATSAASVWNGSSSAPGAARGQDGEEPTVASLLAAVNNANPKARREAVEALAGAGDDVAVHTLGQLVLNDAEVRETAAMTLAGMGSSKALGMLGQILSDSRPDVRRNAAEAIASIGGEQALMLLQGSLADADPEVQIVAALALNMLE